MTVGPGTSFSPADIQVTAGATVTWTFAGPGHNVTFSSGPTSGDLTTGQTYQRVMSTAGTFTYSCSNHSGMNGSVLVQ